MNFIYILLFIIYICIPIFICLNIFSSSDKLIRKNRIKYGMISIITTVINIILIVTIFFIKDFDIILKNKYLLFIPILLLICCLISYKVGKGKEKSIDLYERKREMDDAGYIHDNFNNSSIINIDYLGNNKSKQVKDLDNNKGESNIIDFSYLEDKNDTEKL